MSRRLLLSARRRSRWEAGFAGATRLRGEEVTEENSEASAGEAGREGGGAEAGGKITASKVRSPAVGRRRYSLGLQDGGTWRGEEQ